MFFLGPSINFYNYLFCYSQHSHFNCTDHWELYVSPVCFLLWQWRLGLKSFSFAQSAVVGSGLSHLTASRMCKTAQGRSAVKIPDVRVPLHLFFFFTVCGLDQSQQQIHQLIFIKSEIHL